jgi:hypothetical protein
LPRHPLYRNRATTITTAIAATSLNYHITIAATTTTITSPH